MNKVLIITYYWPPGSGAGVQRWLKFSKYLPKYGWEPVILTVDPDFATYPALDDSLNNEVPSEIKVYKTRATDYFRFYKKNKSGIPSAGFANNDDKGVLGPFLKFLRGNFFIPDPRRGWNKFAFKKASEIIENDRINFIITTSPPHSTQLIGLKLKKKYPGIIWIADMRDPWTDIYYYKQFYPTCFSKKIDTGYERQVLTSADKIITVGKSLKELFASKISGLNTKIEIISNGYDEDDFSGITACDPAIFTISYIGTLSDSYPVQGLLDALSLLKVKAVDFRLRFIGLVAQKQKELIISAAGNTNVEFIPYVDHPSAIKYMLNSTALLLIIPDHHSNKSIITGKLFEYIASGKPVICLGPVDGDAAGILRETGLGITFSYMDSYLISDYLSTLSSGKKIFPKMSPKVFSRSELTGKLIPLLFKPE
jgi:glycosyltransferase involved in cell wall biosynthesis